MRWIIVGVGILLALFVLSRSPKRGSDPLSDSQKWHGGTTEAPDEPADLREPNPAPTAFKRVEPDAAPGSGHHGHAIGETLGRGR